MVRILQVIFGLDAVSGQLGIARKRLVFLKQLRRVPALAVILPVAGIAGHALRALSTAATTTAALTIVDQLVVSLSHWRRNLRSPLVFPSTESVPSDVSGSARTTKRKSTLPCRQPLEVRERGDVVGGRYRERVIFVRAVPSLDSDVMTAASNSKPFKLNP